VPANAPEGTAARLRTLADEIEAEGLTPSVAEEVNDATAGQRVTQQDLYTNLNIEQIEDTRILQFSYTDTDQEKARLVVNHVADAHATQIPLTNQIYYRGAPTQIGRAHV
jgi:capsular polysaccharide biosynthesis protein